MMNRYCFGLLKRLSIVLILFGWCGTTWADAEVSLFQVSDASQNPPDKPVWEAGKIPFPCEGATTKIEDRGKGVMDRVSRSVTVPTYSVHHPPTDKKNGTAVVICPGGGYAVACIDKEGHDTARWLNSLGVTAVVLTYRCGPCARNGAPRADVQEALRMTRANADAWGIKKDRIGVLGYSAGGHLASTAATHFTSNSGGNRPDFAILIYPVISMDADASHGGSRRNLLGDNPSEAMLKEFSNELRVNERTPPTFLVHAVDDGGVKVENSLLFYRAMKKHKRPVTLAIYESGGHGFGLGVWKCDAQKWPGRCAEWLAEQGFIGQTE